VAVAIFWGGTFVAGRLLAGEVHPYCAAFIRFAISSCFLVVIAHHELSLRPKLGFKLWGYLALAGLTGIASYNMFFFRGLEHIEAARAALIIALNPVAIAIGAAFFFKEPLDWVKVLGILLSVSGAIIVITDGQIAQIWRQGLGLGELYILICVLSWVSYSLLGKIIIRQLSPLSAVCYASLIGTVLLFGPAYQHGLFDAVGGYGLKVWSCLLYLALFGTVISFCWYYQGIRLIGPTRAGVFINIVPLSAIVFGFLLLDERLNYFVFIGALFIISGVSTTNTSQYLMEHWRRWSVARTNR
jgi:drug/metabolite transporter (DMT)-like permease